MGDIEITINSQGHRQYVDKHDTDICPCCQEPYTNEGEGVLCPFCADNQHLFDEE